MEVNTVRFGEVTIDEQKIISFPEGLPGLEQCRRFTLLQFEESAPVKWLQNLEQEEICLPLIDSFVALPDYAFDLSDDDARDLQLASPDDLHVLSVLLIPEHMELMTLNQAAPIVINTKNGQGRQIILSSGEYQARMPFFGRLVELMREGETHAGAVAKDQ